MFGENRLKVAEFFCNLATFWGSFEQKWNVCRKTDSKEPSHEYKADLSSYSDDPPSDLCAGGAFCWVDPTDQCPDYYVYEGYCGYSIEGTHQLAETLETDIDGCKNVRF